MAENLDLEKEQAKVRELVEGKVAEALKNYDEKRAVEEATRAAKADNGASAKLEEYRSLVESMKRKEQRSLTANGAGSVNVVPGIVRAMIDYGKLSNLCSTFYGENSKTTIQVFAPHMAKPQGQTEGATGIAGDSTAVLKGVDVAVKPFYSLLPISRLAQFSTDIESNVNAIFGESFGACWDDQIINGAGTTASPFTGLFSTTMTGTMPAGNIVTAASATATTWKEFATLARKIKAIARDLSKVAIIVNPDVMSLMLTSTGAVSAIEQEYINKNTICGIPVIESTYAPSTMTTGKFVAVAANFAHYAVAVAQQVNIDYLPSVGSDNITVQAWAYANGLPLIHTASVSSFYYLKLA